ncbi:hypothetical protein [Virgibacillus sp. Bac332]|uniref:hypothetical protein n=1 Tax=Virgibacillus sp. Bac332 TaxID=2419842 RepID=UPI000EF49159|nr:hypothetical protein [Virgibacillus sp. Bac332]
MEKLAKLLGEVEEYIGNDGIMGMNYNIEDREFHVQVSGDTFLDLANNRVMTECPRNNNMFPREVHFHIENVKFFTILREVDYEHDYAHLFETTDEEFVTSGLTEQEVMMKDSGHKMQDFI